MTVQRLPDGLPYHPEAHVRVRGAYTAPDAVHAGSLHAGSLHAGVGAPDLVLRAPEPISAELGGFILRHLVSTWDDADARPAAAYTLDALLASGEPWPVHLALHLLRRIADVLDAADAAGVELGTFTPRCVALDGPYVVLAPGEHPAAAEPAYVAPEQLQPGALVDARASQYGLALLASTLLSASPHPPGVAGGYRAPSPAWGASAPGRSPTSPAGMSPAVQRLLLTARDPEPTRRFSRAGDLVTALEAACAEWWPTGSEATAPPGARWPSLGAAPRGGTSATLVHRLAGVGALVGVAALAGAGAGWYAAWRPAVAAPSASASPASAPVAAAPPLTARGSAAPFSGTLVVPTPVGGEVASAALGIAPPPSEIATPPGAPAPRPLPDRLAAYGDPAPRPVARGRARAPSVQQLGALASAVVLPSGDNLVPSLRRAVSSPAEFAAAGLRRAESPRATTPDTQAREPGDAMPGATHAEWAAGAQPRYPASLLATRVGGQVVARYVVDSEGHVDPSTVTIARSDHRLFEEAVRESLRQARYRPAENGGRRVSATVEQTFRFAPPR